MKKTIVILSILLIAVLMTSLVLNAGDEKSAKKEAAKCPMMQKQTSGTDKNAAAACIGHNAVKAKDAKCAAECMDKSTAKDKAKCAAECKDKEKCSAECKEKCTAECKDKEKCSAECKEKCSTECKEKCSAECKDKEKCSAECKEKCSKECKDKK